MSRADRESAESIWRSGDVRLLLTSALINDIGDWVLELALPLFVYRATDSGITTAAVYLVQLGVHATFGAYGGRIADTLSLKPTLVVTSLAQVVALAPLLVVTEWRIWPVFVVAVLQGLIRAVNDPAFFAVLPRLVGDDQLVAANSALQGAASIARLLGAAAGGFILEFGGMTTVAIADAATFLIAALLAAGLSSRANDRAVASEDGPVDTSIRAGVEAARGRPGIPSIVGIGAIANIVFGGFSLLFIAFVTDYLNGTESDVGLLRSSSALAGLLAVGLIGYISARVTPARLFAFGFVAFGLVAAGFVNGPSFTTKIWPYAILYGATGFPNIASMIGMRSTLQLFSPAEAMGRISGLFGSINNAMFGVGAISAGVLLEITGARTILNVHAAMLSVCGLIAWRLVVPVEPVIGAAGSAAAGS